MIEFVNIKSGERVKLEDPHHIGAYLNSSDLGVNSNKGQDFGWRLAPEIVVRIEEMSQDGELLDKLATRLGVGVDEVTIIHLVQHISALAGNELRMKEAAEERNPKHKADYEAEIEARRKKEWDEVPGKKSEVKAESIGPVEEKATTIAPAEEKAKK